MDGDFILDAYKSEVLFDSHDYYIYTYDSHDDVVMDVYI